MFSQALDDSRQGIGLERIENVRPWRQGSPQALQILDDPVQIINEERSAQLERIGADLGSAAEEIRKIMTTKEIPEGFSLRVGVRGGEAGDSHDAQA